MICLQEHLLIFIYAQHTVVKVGVFLHPRDFEGWSFKIWAMNKNVINWPWVFELFCYQVPQDWSKNSTQSTHNIEYCSLDSYAKAILFLLTSSILRAWMLFPPFKMNYNQCIWNSIKKCGWSMYRVCVSFSNILIM